MFCHFCATPPPPQVRERQQELAEIETKDSGKPYDESMGNIVSRFCRLSISCIHDLPAEPTLWAPLGPCLRFSQPLWVRVGD